MILEASMVAVAGLVLFKAHQTNRLEQVLAPSLTFGLILLISGHVYNMVERVPFLVTNPDGRLELISGQFRGQFKAEVWIITLLYSAAVCGLISIIEGQKANVVNKASGFKRITIGVLLFLASYHGIRYVGRFKVSDI